MNSATLALESAKLLTQFLASLNDQLSVDFLLSKLVEVMYKILIRHNGQVYKFLNYEFQDERDGSLYIVFDRLGKGPGMNWGSRTENIPTTYAKFKISYHPCGHVRFHNIGGSPKSIHCEPIYAITKKQPLTSISLPNIESLTPTEEVENGSVASL